MRDKPRASPSLGLEATPSLLKGAEISIKNGKPFLNNLISITLDKEHTIPHNVKPLYIEEQEAGLRSAVNRSLVVTGIAAKDVLIRSLDLQLTKEKDIDAIAEFQAEPLLPFPAEEGVMDWTVLEKGKERTRLTLAATKTDPLSQNIELWHSIEVEPEVIGCEPYALAAFSRLFLSKENSHIHIYFGYQDTTCVLVKNGKVASAQTLQTGLKHWIEAAAIDWGVPFEEGKEKLLAFDARKCNEERQPELGKSLNRLKMEITRIVFALSKQTEDGEISEILASGEGANITGMPEMVCKNLKMDVRFPEVIEGFSDASREEIMEHSVTIGLALTGIPQGAQQINFRKNDFAYPDPWKRIKKPMAVYLGLCFILAFSIYYFGLGYIANREDRIRTDYMHLLALMKKPNEQLEKQINPKETHIPAPISLSQQDIQTRLDAIDKEIRSTPDIFPLLPNTPRVSDFLAWLCTLPIVSEKSPDQPGAPRLVLDSLSYKMVKRPELNRMKEKYQIKVELEFTTSTPRFARELHDFLLAPNEMVDSTGDVKWNADKDRYRTSFFLKDKTLYPTSRK